MAKGKKINLDEAINIVSGFKNSSLKETLKELEKLEVKSPISDFETIFSAAKVIKEASMQIDEIVHAAGIMRAKEVWLEKDEIVTYMSLGAGNHQGRFDLETNFRIAEFKFGKWNEGSANGVRRRGYFGNYIGLLTANDSRKKYFVMEDKKAFVEFMEGKACWKKVLSKNQSGFEKLEKFLIEKGKQDSKSVFDIYKNFSDLITIIDFNDIIKTKS
jgi:hypothetical protein